MLKHTSTHSMCCIVRGNVEILYTADVLKCSDSTDNSVMIGKDDQSANDNLCTFTVTILV